MAFSSFHIILYRVFRWKNPVIEMMNMADGCHKYTFCTGNSTYNFQDRKYFVLPINCIYIRDVHASWIFTFDN